MLRYKGTRDRASRVPRYIQADLRSAGQVTWVSLRLFYCLNVADLTLHRYFPGEPEVVFGRMPGQGDIEYVADGMDFSRRTSEGVEAASMKDNEVDAEKKVAAIVTTRPVDQRA